MAFDIAPLASRVEPRIKEKLPLWYGENTVLLERSAFEVREFSILLHYVVQLPNGKQKTIIAKIRRLPDMDMDDAMADRAMQEEMCEEYEILEKIEKVFQEINNPRFCTIRVLGYFEDLSTVVMEKLDMHLLREHFTTVNMVLQSKWQEVFALHLEDSARWLRIYHEQIGERKDESSFWEEQFEVFHQYLCKISEYYPGFKLHPVQLFIEQAHEKYQGMYLSYGIVHFNFDLANIFVTEDNQLGSFDPHYRPGPLYADIAKLLIDLQTRAAQMLTYGWFIRPALQNSFKQAVLNGYFAGQPYDKASLDIFCIMALLEKWLTDEETLAQSSGMKKLVYSLLAPWRRSYFSNLLSKQIKNYGKVL